MHMLLLNWHLTLFNGIWQSFREKTEGVRLSGFDVIVTVPAHAFRRVKRKLAAFNY